MPYLCTLYNNRYRTRCAAGNYFLVISSKSHLSMCFIRKYEVHWTTKGIQDRGITFRKFIVLFGKTGSQIRICSVQSLSRVRLFATPWITARQASLSITNSQSLLKLMPIESVMRSSHLILCCPLLLLPPVPPTIRVFSNESTLCMRRPKYWSFNFSINPSNEHPGLIFRLDWLDLLAVQGTLDNKSNTKKDI